jgi:hypothetical protein
MNLRFRTFLGSADLRTFADLKVKTSGGLAMKGAKLLVKNVLICEWRTGKHKKYGTDLLSADKP